MSRKTFRNQITSEESFKQINPENIKLMEKFLKEKNTRSSDGTIEGYRSDLLIFFTWNLKNNENKLFTDVRKIELSEFFSFAVEEMGWGSARFSRAKSTLSSLGNFIEKFYDDVYPTYRSLALKAVESMPRNKVREKTVLTDEQIDELFKKIDSNEDLQIACWLSLGIASGCRFSEFLRFTTDIVDENCTAFDGLFLETTRAIKTKGRTKKGKMLKKYILKDLFIDRYKIWLVERQKILDENNKSHNFIFIKQNGDPAEESTARCWVKKIEKYLEQDFYPHALRHFYTTKLSRLGIPATLIKELVGWESVEMVETYDDQEARDKTWKELDKLKDHLESKNLD